MRKISPRAPSCVFGIMTAVWTFWSRQAGTAGPLTPMACGFSKRERWLAIRQAAGHPCGARCGTGASRWCERPMRATGSFQSRFGRFRSRFRRVRICERARPCRGRVLELRGTGRGARHGIIRTRRMEKWREASQSRSVDSAMRNAGEASCWRTVMLVPPRTSRTHRMGRRRPPSTPRARGSFAIAWTRRGPRGCSTR